MMNQTKRNNLRKYIWDLLKKEGKELEFIDGLDLNKLVVLCTSSAEMPSEQMRLIRKFNEFIARSEFTKASPKDLYDLYQKHCSIRQTMENLGIAKRQMPENHNKLWTNDDIHFALNNLADCCKITGEDLGRTPGAILKKLAEIL